MPEFKLINKASSNLWQKVTSCDLCNIAMGQTSFVPFYIGNEPKPHYKCKKKNNYNWLETVTPHVHTYVLYPIHEDQRIFYIKNSYKYCTFSWCYPGKHFQPLNILFRNPTLHFLIQNRGNPGTDPTTVIHKWASIKDKLRKSRNQPNHIHPLVDMEKG
jgi:hypothetical protein